MVCSNYSDRSICGGITYNPTRIAQYNTACQEVASEEGCFFFDVYSAMSTGFLVSDYQADQIHLNASGHDKLATILENNLGGFEWFVVIIQIGVFAEG